MKPNRAIAPMNIDRQCPACGVPVGGTVMEFRKTPSGYALLLEDCGHIVTLAVLRDSWGFDLPDPDPTFIGGPAVE